MAIFRLAVGGCGSGASLCNASKNVFETEIKSHFQFCGSGASLCNASKNVFETEIKSHFQFSGSVVASGVMLYAVLSVACF